jgi:hypothetical protein
MNIATQIGTPSTVWTPFRLLRQIIINSFLEKTGILKKEKPLNPSGRDGNADLLPAEHQ